MGHRSRFPAPFTYAHEAGLPVLIVKSVFFAPYGVSDHASYDHGILIARYTGVQTVLPVGAREENHLM